VDDLHAALDAALRYDWRWMGNQISMGPLPVAGLKP
jgi:hypothetical protein